MTYDPTKIDGEINRLRVQATLPTELAGLSIVGLPEKGRLLDVGCGPGFFGANIQDYEPGLNVVGVDRVVWDQAPIVQVKGEAVDLPFKNSSFDGAYARLALRHMSDPEQTIAEMVRVTKVGGWIGAIDSVDSSMHLTHQPKDWSRVMSARQSWFKDRGGWGDEGKCLYGHFVDAELHNIRQRRIRLSTETVAFGWHSMCGVLGPARFYDIVVQSFLDAAREYLGDETPSFRDEWLAARPHGHIDLCVVGGYK